MDDRKRITVAVDKLGNPKIEAHGYHGCGCAEATKSIEAALAGKDDGRNVTLKPEFYEVEREEQQLTQSW